MKQLLANLINAKAMETCWKNYRIQIEEAIIAKTDDRFEVEGSTTIKTETHKIIVNKKLTYKLDQEKYEAMHLLPESKFVNYKPSIDLKKMRTVLASNPGVVEECVTSKPAKTNVKIEEVE